MGSVAGADASEGGVAGAAAWAAAGARQVAMPTADAADHRRTVTARRDTRGHPFVGAVPPVGTPGLTLPHGGASREVRGTADWAPV